MSDRLVDNCNDIDCDAEDAEPRRDRVSTRDPSLKAAWYDYLYIASSASFYIADVVTDLLVSAKYFRNGDYIWFGLTLSCVLGASLVMMMFSLKWFHEDTAKEVSKTKTVVLHVLQLGPLLRYWDCYKNGKRSRRKDVDANCYSIYIEQWRDIAMLRLFEVFIESAPQLVLQLYILAYNRHFDKDSDWLTALSACFSLISLAVSIVSYSKALRDATDHKGKMTWWAFGFQIVWRLSIVASRIVTLVLFASVYKSWILLVIGLHWIGMTVWIQYQKPTFGSDNRISKFIFPVVIGFIYLFCFFNVKDGFTRKRLVFFYVLTFLENCALMGAWLPYRHEYGVVFVAAVAMVFGGFFIGMLALVLYYQCYHPSLKKQGICIRTSHDVPRTEGITYRMACCGTCCLVRGYEDEQSSPPRGSKLHVDIPASRCSLAMGERSTTSSPPFEREIFSHKPSQLQKQYSLEREKMKKEKAERIRRRHSMESAVEKRVARSVEVKVDDSVPVGNGVFSHPRSLPKDFEEIQLRNYERRSENGFIDSVNAREPINAELSNGAVGKPSSLSTGNFKVNQQDETTSKNSMVHSVDVHNPRFAHARNDMHGPAIAVDMHPGVGNDLNQNSSSVFENDRQGIASNVIAANKDDHEVPCYADDAKNIGKSCDDGIHCGTDDQKETGTCDDGVHCGTDDEKETRTSCNDGVHCGTDDEKDVETAKTDKQTKNNKKKDISYQDVYANNTHDVGAAVTPSRPYSHSVNFHHRYSIVSDCISLSSSTSSDNEDNETLVEKANSKSESFTHKSLSSTVAEDASDSNVDEQYPLDNSQCTPNTESLPRSYVPRRNSKQRTINRRSNRVSFPNFVATNLRRGRFSSVRKSREDCTMPVEDTRRHTIDFSILTSRKPYDEITFARLSKTLRPRKFGSVRDEEEKLSLDCLE